MILAALDRHRDYGLLALRLALGAVFAYAHGWGKITGGPEAWEGLGKAIGVLGVPVFAPTFWGFMAAFAEFGGCILLMLGLLYRPAAFMLFFTMLVATVLHWREALPEGMTAEMHFQRVVSRPLELCIVFGGMFLIGPGKISLDHVIQRMWKRQATNTEPSV